MNHFTSILDSASVLQQVSELSVERVATRHGSSDNEPKRETKPLWNVPGIGKVDREEFARMFDLKEGVLYTVASNLSHGLPVKLWPVLLWMYVHQKTALEKALLAPTMSGSGLKLVRTNHGLSLDEMSLVIGYSPRYVRLWEEGAREKISKKYDVFCQLILLLPEKTFMVAFAMAEERVRSAEDVRTLREVRERVLAQLTKEE